MSCPKNQHFYIRVERDDGRKVWLCTNCGATK